MNPTPEEYKALREIAQSARILTAGHDRNPYYEAEWRRLDIAIHQWLVIEETNVIEKLKKLAQMEAEIIDQNKQERYLEELIGLLDLNIALYDSALEQSDKQNVPQELFRLVAAPTDIRYQAAVVVLGE
jgi:hypothetical protein